MAAALYDAEPVNAYWRGGYREAKRQSRDVAPGADGRDCTDRESNPGLMLGKHEFYHYTTSAAVARTNEILLT